MPEAVRDSLFLRACLEVLRDASEPMPVRDVQTRVGQCVEPTPYEREPVNGKLRWWDHLGWRTGEAATIGWMTKRDGRWSLTDAGETILDTYDQDEFLAELRRRHHDVHLRRRDAVKELGKDYRIVADALSVVDPGHWTTYEDLAELVGADSEKLARFLAAGSTKRIASSYRVLRVDGTPPGDGMLHSGHRGMDVVAKLSSEGVGFRGGRADPAQRMTAADIQSRLADLDTSAEESPGRRAWLVRGSAVEGRDLVPVWLRRDSASLAASRLRAVTPPVGRDELRRIVDEDYQHASYAVRAGKFAEFDAFCNRMRAGDYVLTTSQGKAYVGRITGEATYVQSADQRSNLRRTVDWLNPTRPVPFPNLPAPLPAKLHSQSDVVELTEDVVAIESLLTELSIDVTAPAPSPGQELQFNSITKELAADLLIDGDWLQDLADLLWDRKQLILYGPPGTGKTFLARALAAHLADPSAVKLVQFHPSYTYEDFFEGLRPVKPEDGPLTYQVLHGPFRVLVDAARKDPGHPYLLIIDEINRANLAKVFGELYFLLEYRNDAVGLMYSPKEDFTLPDNVFIIGTMNTADRSIALVDAAMRRRFAFVELHPGAPPTAGLLAAWLDRLGGAEEFPHNRDAPALLDALNERIDERDLAIGPSYLMRPEIYRRESGLDRVWQTSILPLLAEHHYGSPPEALDPYRLAALRAALPEPVEPATQSAGQSTPLSEAPAPGDAGPP